MDFFALSGWTGKSPIVEDRHGAYRVMWQGEAVPDPSGETADHKEQDGGTDLQHKVSLLIFHASDFSLLFRQLSGTAGRRQADGPQLKAQDRPYDKPVTSQR
jgi:hypothetical protein